MTGRDGSWRTVDIVVAAVVSGAFGIAFIAWNAAYTAAGPVFAAFPPAQALLYGVWLMPGVVVGLIVRRPGAALFAGVVSASVSVLLAGSPWGADTLLSGAIQGGGAELGFAAGLYRRWTLPFAVLGATLAGIGAAVHDVVLYWPGAGTDFQLAFSVALVLSAVAIAGVGGWLLVRGLVPTGVLRDFPAGREQRRT
jgi:energy-coupling factor transport system permease protein